jgi:hypothetical protein
MGGPCQPPPCLAPDCEPTRKPATEFLAYQKPDGLLEDAAIWLRPAPAARGRPAPLVLPDRRDQPVIGRVLDELTRQPIAGALVEAVAGGSVVASSRSDEAGRFELALGDHGDYRIRARLDGYVPAELNAGELRLDAAGRVEILLHPLPTRLDPLGVEARAAAPSAGLAGFAERAGAGRGVFVSREDLERRGAATAIESMTGLPGIRVSRVSSAGSVVTMQRAVPSIRRGGARCPPNEIDNPACSAGCRVELFVDGVKVQNTPNATLNELMASEIHGIEVYRGAAETPAEFGGSNARCGVIAVWTRRGG